MAALEGAQTKIRETGPRERVACFPTIIGTGGRG